MNRILILFMLMFSLSSQVWSEPIPKALSYQEYTHKLESLIQPLLEASHYLEKPNQNTNVEQYKANMAIFSLRVENLYTQGFKVSEVHQLVSSSILILAMSEEFQRRIASIDSDTLKFFERDIAKSVDQSIPYRSLKKSGAIVSGVIAGFAILAVSNIFTKAENYSLQHLINIGTGLIGGVATYELISKEIFLLNKVYEEVNLTLDPKFHDSLEREIIKADLLKI